MKNTQFTNIVLRAMHDALKPQGFRKSGSIFSRSLPEVAHLIGLQKSQSSNADSIKVTVNLAIWIFSLAPVRAEKAGKPNVWSAHWQERIGTVSPERKDTWWLIGTVEEANSAAQEIVELLLNWGLPTIQRVMSEQAIVALWRSGEYGGLTAFERDKYLTKLLTLTR